MSDVDAHSDTIGHGDRNTAARRGPDAAVNVVVNGETVSVPVSTLSELLAVLGYAPEQVATAVNGEFVPRPARTSQAVHAGDRIEIVSPRQGG